ncbi:MAG: hypothetical protein IPH12_01640 [Saprospirales bacterium]|nr:hypothetical protein [Saprospirales bacterium]MBK8923423.1 hypothetical protein [Saprospirales bacterium]
MNIRQAHFRLKAALLGLAFVAAWGLKTSHLLLLHHVHHTIPVCEAEHDENSAHLHDARYNPDDCSICAHLLAVPELVSVSAALAAPAPARQDCLAVRPRPLRSCSPEVSRSRGPPVL